MLHVASDAPKFRFDFFRQGAGVAFAGSSPWFSGPAPGGSPAADADFGWAGFRFDVPADWASGVYVAVIVEWDGIGVPPPVTPPAGLYATDGQLLFVLRSAEPGAAATILCKFSLFTFHAYNITGGGAFYRVGIPSVPPDPPGAKVTLLRPGGGTGGDLAYPDPDLYDPSLHPQTFPFWDAPFISWLEGRGAPIEYCTDLDIHSDQGLLPNYRLLLSVGHDEYWSAPMRSNIESFIASGGNVAFFSGNTCWWRVHLVDNDTAMVCAKDTACSGPDLWWSGLAGDPENSVTGVSYRNGGGWWGSKRAQTGYAVQFSGHWVFDGIMGLSDGQVIGKAVVPPVVGYECDGAQFVYDSAGNAVPTGDDGTPTDFTILGLAPLTPPGDGTSGWSQCSREGSATSPYTATMGIYEHAGTVFTAATCEWPRVAASGSDTAVTMITDNVLTRLSAPLHISTELAVAMGSSGSTTVEAGVNAGDGSISYTWWDLGGTGRGFLDLGGQTGDAPAAALVGSQHNYLFVVARGTDGGLYLNQGELGRGFTGWADMGFQAGAAAAMASSGDTVALVSVGPDGSTSYDWWDLGGTGRGFLDLGGQTGDAPAAALVGPRHNYLFVVARGTDGGLFLNQGELGGPFTGFADMSFAAKTAAAMSSSGDTTVLIGVSPDGSVSYTWWALGQGSQAWAALDGQLTGTAPAAALVGPQDNYLFVVIKGMDGGLYLNQGTLGGPFTGWTAM
ncbi:MAG TPA: N,N-dimethylformamidase beta subunit family domain-containing protein [Streptosporangiaceae bacterium]|nr:N,N-dimethylformamidase beta subunit family domain-containing protein [Streptosporangiaceae bacterium]